VGLETKELHSSGIQLFVTLGTLGFRGSGTDANRRSIGR
jgi:hypothetical protein